jgi:hypothetical protein
MDSHEGDFLLLFCGEQRDRTFEATELKEQSSEGVLVFEVIRRGKFFGKAWVDARSSLPLKFVTTGGSDRVSGSEAVFDYEPISEEVFDLTIPTGYVKLPPRKPPSISGTVVDKSGKGVAGAEVCAPCECLHGDRAVSARTDEKGNFLMELPSHATCLGLPMVIRAFKADDPYHVAWMFIRNPEDEDAGHNYDEGHHAEGLIRDEEALLRDIGGNPGQVVFKEINGGRVAYELKGVVLRGARWMEQHRYTQHRSHKWRTQGFRHNGRRRIFPDRQPAALAGARAGSEGPGPGKPRPIVCGSKWLCGRALERSKNHGCGTDL